MILFKRHILAAHLVVGAFFLLLHSCAPLTVKPTRPLGDDEIARHIDSIRKQGRLVQTLFSSGGVVLKGPDSKARSNVLIVATKYPLRIKIEITHPWGRPLLHMLVNETRIKALSFPEKRFYSGPISSSHQMTFFPIRFGADQMWNLVRGYPALELHDKAISQKENQVSLVDSQGNIIQIIEFDTEKKLPSSTFFPMQDMAIAFSHIQNEDEIYYSRKIVIMDHKNQTHLTLNLREMVFNTVIPKSIFELKVPADFETIFF
ncbi:MAG: hypothetical protein V2J25_03755 [Desulfatiglans sp.]|nr:hypothetical protein [Desulfatiglans sp.]